MTFACGHANELESARIAELEAKLRDRKITSEEHLELALLNLEPLHDGFRAAELFQEILDDNPRHGLSKLWLAFTDIYELMDPDALRDAVRLCDQLLEQGAPPELQAAALLLKAAAVRKLGKEDPVVYAQASVTLAPGWISNRVLLATIHQERGERTAAEEELRQAIEVSSEHPMPESFADQMFELLITARGSYRIADHLKEQLLQMEVPAKPSGRLRKFLIASAVAAVLVLCAVVGLLILAFLTPPLVLNHEGEVVHASVATLGEYPTTIDRILVIDLETSETVWELKPRSPIAQIRGFDLRPGLNPSALKTTFGAYDVVVPAGRPSFLLRKGGHYRLTVWSGSWKSSASFTP